MEFVTRLPDFHYRLDEMSAALRAVQVERLDEILADRAVVAALYTELLRRLEDVAAPTRDGGHSRAPSACPEVCGAAGKGGKGDTAGDLLRRSRVQGIDR